MSNRLTSAQRALFKSDYHASSNFQWVCEVSDGVVSTDITDYVLSYGDTTDTLFGYNEKAGRRLEYPSLSIRLDNSGGQFTVGHVNSLIPNGVGNYYIKFGINEVGSTGEPKPLVQEALWAMVDLELSPGQATITAVHQLESGYKREWSSSDRVTTGWAGVKYGPDFTA